MMDEKGALGFAWAGVPDADEEYGQSFLRGFFGAGCRRFVAGDRSSVHLKLACDLFQFHPGAR